jgi:hypothetical protein
MARPISEVTQGALGLHRGVIYRAPLFIYKTWGRKGQGRLWESENIPSATLFKTSEIKQSNFA